MMEGEEEEKQVAQIEEKWDCPRDEGKGEAEKRASKVVLKEEMEVGALDLQLMRKMNFTTMKVSIQ